MIKLIIISKDRACQLQCLLKSLELNAPKLYKIQINYKYSNDDFRIGYEKLQKEKFFLDIDWKLETNLRRDFISGIQTNKYKLFSMMTDDCIYYRKQNVIYEEIEDLLGDSTLHFSTRLGRNSVVQNYQTNQLVHVPNYEEVNGQFLRWRYKNINSYYNTAYFGAQDGDIWDSSFFYSVVASILFNGFRELESNLCQRRKEFEYRPYICSFRQSSVVNIPVNQSQGNLYSSEKYHISLEEFNNKYLDGYKINLEKTFENVQIVGAHQEILPILHKE